MPFTEQGISYHNSLDHKKAMRNIAMIVIVEMVRNVL